MIKYIELREELVPQFVIHGRLQFAEVSGDALHFASREAVLAARHGAAQSPFDVAVRVQRGHRVLSPGADECWIAAGVADAYRELGAESTIIAPVGPDSSEQKFPGRVANIHVLQALAGDPYRYDLSFHLSVDAQPRGRLFQETKATLNPASWNDFLRTQIIPALRSLPRPFRVALAVGGTSAEASLGTAARADAGEFDDLTEEGGDTGAPIRQRALEIECADLINEELCSSATQLACDQVRVIRMVRHGGSLPIGLHIGLPGDQLVRVTLNSQGMKLVCTP